MGISINVVGDVSVSRDRVRACRVSITGDVKRQGERRGALSVRARKGTAKGAEIGGFPFAKRGARAALSSVTVADLDYWRWVRTFLAPHLDTLGREERRRRVGACVCSAGAASWPTLSDPDLAYQLPSSTHPELTARLFSNDACRCMMYICL